MRDVRRPVAIAAALLAIAATAPMQPVAATAAARVAPVPVNGCWGDDHGRPNLTGLTLSTAAVDVRSAAQPVTIRATVEDTGGPGAPSGVAGVTARLSSPREVSEDESPEIPPVTLRRDATGAWVGRAVLPRRTTGGTWRLDRVVLFDANKRLRNEHEYLDDDLVAAGFSRTLDVTSVTDRTRPSVTSFKLSKRVVDTRRSARTIKVTARVRDATSGVRLVQVLASERGTSQRLAFVSLRRRSGSPSDGVWAGRLPLGRWLTNGTWDFLVDATDQALNVRELRTRHRHLAGTRFPGTFRVISGTDTRKPVARSVHSSPATVDVRAHDGTARVRVHLADTGSGVASVRAFFTGPGGFGPVKGSLHRTSGTRRSGTWSGTVTVTRCLGRAGRWTGSVRVLDRAGNTRRVSPAGMSFREISGDHTTPSARVQSPTPVTGPAVLAFDEDVAGVTATSVVVRREAFPTGPAIAGTWTCRTAAGATSDCVAGPVRTASFTPAVAFAPGDHTMTVNPEHELGVTDLAGNPYIPRDEQFTVSGLAAR